MKPNISSTGRFESGESEFPFRKQFKSEKVNSFKKSIHDLPYQKYTDRTGKQNRNVEQSEEVTFKKNQTERSKITEEFVSDDLLETESERLGNRKTVKYSPFERLENKARIHKPQLPPEFKGEEVLFGIHPVRLALMCKRRVLHRVYMTHRELDQEVNEKLVEIESLAARADVPTERVSSGFLRNIAGGRPHQGVCMNVGPLKLESCVEEISDPAVSTDTLPLWLVVDRVVDPMNFGAVLRSAHFLGANRLLSVEAGNCSLTPVVSKASSGAMEVMKIFKVDDLLTFLQEKQSSGWSVVGTNGWTRMGSFEKTSKCIELSQFKMEKPTILVIGNEGDGVRNEVLSICDKVLVISPSAQVHDGVHSLNVSVATGIVLHSLLNGRRQEDQ
jgi:21S rRNA (GM2251-2'-O)-methyltransferase